MAWLSWGPLGGDPVYRSARGMMRLAMALSDKGERKRLIERYASRLKFPYLFLLIAALFVADLILPDAIPFVDEILLGLIAVLLGTWKERKSVEPPMKNVTPPGDRM